MEWVESSLSSAGISVSPWVLAVFSLFAVGMSNHSESAESTKMLLDFVELTALATHGLLWWQVLRGGWALWLGAGASGAWLVIGAVLWLLLLLGFQLLCLLAWYALSTPSTGDANWLRL
jgi:hypothetical protein